MEHEHLDAAALERLLAADRTAEQNKQLFHLLAVCPRCREVGGWLLELHRANALPPVFGPIDAALARSRAEAPRLLEELLPVSPEERLARLHADPRFVSWGLCELLVRRSCQTAAQEASEAVHLADLAVHVGDRVADGGLFEESWVYQLRSLAWAALGNARRVHGDHTGAERSFDMADSWWEAGTRGTEDALGYEPILLDLKASLRLAQRRFPEAFKLLAGAVELFLHGEHRDPHLAGKSLILKAGAHIEQGDTESAVQARVAQAGAPGGLGAELAVQAAGKIEPVSPADGSSGVGGVEAIFEGDQGDALGGEELAEARLLTLTPNRRNLIV